MLLIIYFSSSTKCETLDPNPLPRIPDALPPAFFA